jgi:hypothetical protein
MHSMDTPMTRQERAMRDILQELADESNWVDPEPGGYSDITLADDLIVRLRQALNPPKRTLWCPICKTYHHNVGERTDAGKVTRPCPLLADFDARNWMGP